MRRVLILGGTTEASTIARALDGRDDVEVTTSFAGVTIEPRAAAGAQRVGGFGGPDGLARHLQAEQVDALVDATHPFAARMRWNAHEAAAAVGVPRIRVERPPWAATADDQWVPVGDVRAAARAAGEHRRVFLTIGRTQLEPFASCPSTWFLVRSINPPDLPAIDAEVVLGRGPFTVDDEVALLLRHRIDAVVTKNSGGTAAEAKLLAARSLGLPVVVVERPPNPPGPIVGTATEALRWLDQVGPPTGVPAPGAASG